MNKIHILIISWFYQFSINAILWTPILFPTLIQEFSLTLKDTVWIISIHDFFVFSSSILGGFLCDKFGTRITASIGCLLYLIGLLNSCFSQSIIPFYILYSVVGGVGSGILVNVSITLLYSWWDIDKILFPICIIFTGAALSSILYTNVVGIITSLIGWRLSLIIYCCISACILVPMIWFSQTKNDPPKFSFQNIKSFINVDFILLILTGLTFGICFIPVFSNYSLFLKEKSIFDQDYLVNMAFACLQFSSILIYIIVAIISYYMVIKRPTIIILISIILTGGIIIWWSFINDSVSAFIFPLLYGSFFGLFLIFFNTTIAEIFKEPIPSIIIGLLISSLNVGQLTGPYIFNIIIEANGGYFIPTIFLSCFAFGSSVFLIIFIIRRQFEINKKN